MRTNALPFLVCRQYYYLNTNMHTRQTAAVKAHDYATPATTGKDKNEGKGKELKDDTLVKASVKRSGNNEFYHADGGCSSATARQVDTQIRDEPANPGFGPIGVLTWDDFIPNDSNCEDSMSQELVLLSDHEDEGPEDWSFFDNL